MAEYEEPLVSLSGIEHYQVKQTAEAVFGRKDGGGFIRLPRQEKRVQTYRSLTDAAYGLCSAINRAGVAQGIAFLIKRNTELPSGVYHDPCPHLQFHLISANVFQFEEDATDEEVLDFIQNHTVDSGKVMVWIYFMDLQEESYTKLLQTSVGYHVFH